MARKFPTEAQLQAAHNAFEDTAQLWRLRQMRYYDPNNPVWAVERVCGQPDDVARYEFTGPDAEKQARFFLRGKCLETAIAAANKADVPSGKYLTSEWTEGVCADGAAILRDGTKVAIGRLLEILNAAERMAYEVELRTRPYADSDDWPLAAGIHAMAMAFRNLLDEAEQDD